MFTLSDQERKHIIRHSASAITHLLNGEDAAGVLSGIYCQNLTDKSPQQGQMMAQEVLKQIGNFQKTFDEALDAPAEYLSQKLREQLSPLSQEEQCQFLRKGLQQLGCDSDLPTADSPQIRDQLLQTFSHRLLETKEHMIPDIPETFGKEPVLARDALKDTIGEEMLLAVTAMVIYTMAKSGRLSAVPGNVTLAQVVTGVCAEDKLTELSRIAAQNPAARPAAVSQRKTLIAACLSRTAETGGALLLATVASLFSLFTLFGGLMIALGVILSVYYKVHADMVRDEASRIPYYPISVYPVETVVESPRTVADKHLPWPQPEEKQEHRTTEATTTVFSES